MTTWAKTEVTNENISAQLVDGAYITLQCMDTNGGDGYYFNGATTKSSSLKYANFFKVVSNGSDAFYLQRVSDSKYVANSSNAVAMVDATTDAAAFTFSIATATSWTTTGKAANNGVNSVRFTTSSTYLNTQATAATPIYFTGTGGYSVWQVYTYTTDEVESYNHLDDGNYSIKNTRSSKYAYWTGDASQISQMSDLKCGAEVWTLTYDATNKCYKLGNKATTNYYASTTSFTADGKAVYIKAGTTAGSYSISESSDFSGYTCWDDQDNTTHIGYWTYGSGGVDYIITALTDDEVSELTSYQEFTAPTVKESCVIGTVGTTSVSSITSGKYYVIKGYNQGTDAKATGYLYDNGSSTLKAATTQATTLDYLWYIQKRSNATYYLYNVGTEQFVNVAGGVVTTATATGTKLFGGTDGVWAIMNPANKSCIDFGSTGTSLVTWNEDSSAPSGSRRCEIYEAEIVEPTTNVTLNLTDAAGNTFTVSKAAEAGTIPALTGAYGYTLSDESWSEDKLTLTATITFPFATSSATTKNATGIQSALGSSKWYMKTVDDVDYVYGAPNATATYSTQNNFNWYIYPSLSEDGVFTFKIQNVGDSKYIPTSDAAQSTNTKNALVEEASAGSFQFSLCNNTTGGFTTNGTIFLTKNNSTGEEPIWFWTKNENHRGSNLSFPAATVITLAGLQAQLATLANTTKFELVEGATVISPTEYVAPSEINAAIDAAKAVDNTTVEPIETFLASDNASKIKKFQSASASYGAPLVSNVKLETEWSTVILPINYSKPEGWTKYTCASVNGSILALVEDNNGTNKNTPYIVYAPTKVGTTYQFIGYTIGAGTEDVTVGALTGVLSADKISAPAGSYIFNNGKFVQSTEATDVNKLTVYVTVDDAPSTLYCSSSQVESSETGADAWTASSKVSGDVFTPTKKAVGTYSTIVLPYDATANGAALFKMAGKDLDADNNIVSVTFERIADTDEEANNLEAGVPYLYRATAATQTFTKTGTDAETVTPVTDVEGFTGSYVDIMLPANNGYYFLNTTDEGKQEFTLAGNYIASRAFKCYISTFDKIQETPEAQTPEQNARRVTLGGSVDTTTGIFQLNTNDVKSAADGKYINNGRVVIVKNGQKFNVAGQAVK